jgi:hypothetical protein
MKKVYKRNTIIFIFDKHFIEVLKLEHEPFSYCIIDDFLLDKTNDQFCSQLTNELGNIKLNQKNNDLYKFQQVRKLNFIRLFKYLFDFV